MMALHPKTFRETKSRLSIGGNATPLLLGKVAIAALLLIWIATSLASVFWRVLPQPQLQEIDAGADSRAFAPAPKATRPPVDIGALKDIALFGKEEEPAPVVETTPEPVVQQKVEETRLNLELVGSFANENQKRAYAIIAKGKKQDLYGVNEEVAGLNNVKLLKVFADRVILDNRGRQEALLMYPEGKPITSGSVVSPELRAQSRGSNADADESNPGALARLNPNQRLEKISDVIRFSRKTQDGKMVGFRVLPGRNRAAFDQTGLKLNDVVTAIDGQALDNLKAANQIYQQKRNATQASLSVLRGEEQLTVDIDLNNINVN